MSAALQLELGLAFGQHRIVIIDHAQPAPQQALAVSLFDRDEAPRAPPVTRSPAAGVGRSGTQATAPAAAARWREGPRPWGTGSWPLPVSGGFRPDRGSLFVAAARLDGYQVEHAALALLHRDVFEL